MADELIQYPPDEPFPGPIGRTLETSTPAWPARPEAPDGAPNVVVIVLDDVGYGQLSPFGGLCETPNLDRLAERGLRFSNFHTTALCSPTRGCLLTGRNHHTLGLSAITEMSLGYPAHNGTMGFEHGFISETLVGAGYNTFAVGKWHLTPPAETTPAGPYHRWPLGRGFERYYGFLGGDTDQWHPDLTHDNHSVRQPATPQEGYHLNADLADHAIEFIKDAHANAPDKPFFLWFATGAGHAPHQVEPEWIERYAGAFDMGWDEYRRIVFERQLEHRAGAGRHRAVRARPRRRAVGRAERRRQAHVHPPDGGLRRVPQPDRPPHRPGARLHRHPGRARQHDRDRGVGQRGQRRGRRARHPQRGPVLQPGPRDARGQPGRRSTSGAARTRSTTTRGAGPGPATRRSGAGSARPTAAA